MNIPLLVLTSEVLKNDIKGNNELIKLGGIPINNGTELINYLNNLDTMVTSKKSENQSSNFKQGSIDF